MASPYRVKHKLDIPDDVFGPDETFDPDEIARLYIVTTELPPQQGKERWQLELVPDLTEDAASFGAITVTGPLEPDTMLIASAQAWIQKECGKKKGWSMRIFVCGDVIDRQVPERPPWTTGELIISR